MRYRTYITMLSIWIIVIFAISFAWIVRKAHREYDTSGPLQIYSAVRAVASFPRMVIETYNLLFAYPQSVPNRFASTPGFTVHDKATTSYGYVLVPRFSMERGTPIVDLVEENTWNVKHTWNMDINELNNKLKENTIISNEKYQMFHPYIMDDGSIIFHDEKGPLVRLSSCNEIMWAVDIKAHHSIAIDHEGNIWTPILRPHKEDDDFEDDRIAKFSPNGELLYEKPIKDILIENGYRGLIYGVQDISRSIPIEERSVHLNYIQPALYDGKYWKKGDLLLSLRHTSTVFLYRPSTNKILWLQVGPWLNQHRPDFVGEDSVSVFGNDVVRAGGYRFFEGGHNTIYLYNLSSGTVSTPYDPVMKSLQVMTAAGGGARILDDGSAIIDEEGAGRLLRISQKGIVWSFVNTIDTQTAGIIGWSRYLSKDEMSSISLECKKNEGNR